MIRNQVYPYFTRNASDLPNRCVAESFSVGHGQEMSEWEVVFRDGDMSRTTIVAGFRILEPPSSGTLTPLEVC